MVVLTASLGVPLLYPPPLPLSDPGLQQPLDLVAKSIRVQPGTMLFEVTVVRVGPERRLWRGGTGPMGFRSVYEEGPGALASH